MAKLSDIADVVIELRTASIAKANFGIPMIAAVSNVLANRAEVFYDYNSALKYKNGTAGLEQYILDAVRVAFSQTPRIDRVVVGKLDGAAAGMATLLPAKFTETGNKAPASTAFDLNVDGTPVTYTTASGSTLEDMTTVLAGMLAKLQGTAGLSTKYTMTSDPANFTITFTPKAPNTIDAQLTATQDMFSVTNAGSLLRPLAEQLDKIQGFTPWYGFALVGFKDTVNDDMVKQAAAYAEAANPAIQFFAASNDATIPVPGDTDTLSELNKLQYYRTMMIPSKNDDFLEPVAEMARFYVGQPGQIIAGLKTITAVTPSDWTPTETTTIWGKMGNTYEKYAPNTFLLNPGKAVNGEWFDVVRDRDWLTDDIQKAMASAMIRNPKIPYTNEGITILYNILQGRLRNAQKQGVIAPDQKNSLGQTVPGFVITVPNAADLDADTRNSRKLTMSFVALLAGAIQMVRIDGVLTYSYEG